MADQKLSQLDAAVNLTGAEIHILQGEANKRAPIALFAKPTTYTAAGDIENLPVTPTPGTDQVIAARITTGDGLLTIDVPETGVAFALVLLASDANGTKEIGVTAGAATVKWANRIAIPLAPKTDETIELSIRCVDGAVRLAAAYSGVPA